MYPKQTTAEEIIYLLDNGYYVPVEWDRDFSIFSPHKDGYGNYRMSAWSASIERAKERIGEWGGENKEEISERIKERNWKLHEPYLPILKPLKKGTKVYVKENAKEICEELDFHWDKEMQEMAGQVLEIQESSVGDYTLYNKDKSDWYYFPKEALIPIFEENPEEDKTEEAIALLKEKGYKIIKE